MSHTTSHAAPSSAAPFFAGCLAILAGSAAGLWAPGSVATILGLIALIRICWIDENIRGDLEPAERMPPGYARTLDLRRRLAAALFRSAPQEITCPRLLATQLRAQGHAIFAFLFALLATTLAAAAGDTPIGLLAAGVALVLAFGRVDRLAAADAHLRRGEALPGHMLDDRGRLSRLLMNAPGNGAGPTHDRTPKDRDGPR